MTIIEPTADAEVSVEPELCWLNLADMAPHPDNPRTSLGDLTELTRSIRSHGIIEPLVVLVGQRSKRLEWWKVDADRLRSACAPVQCDRRGGDTR